MRTLVSDIPSVSIHPITGQWLNTGLLPAGTRIYSWRPGTSEYVIVRVKDANGFVGTERVLREDLERNTR